MSWTDAGAIGTIRKLKDLYNIKVCVETGTWRGVNAELYASIFDRVFTVENDFLTAEAARRRLKRFGSKVEVIYGDSSLFLKRFKDNSAGSHPPVFIYLDAHFFKPDEDWVAVEELKALQGFLNCVLCIHDFDNGELGHLIYNDVHFGWDVIGEYIRKVNPNFHYYTNTRDGCRIYDEDDIKELPITIDVDLLDNLRFANSSDVKKYRGILYATPTALDLNQFQLREFINV